MKRLKKEASAKITVRKSTFTAYLFPCANVEEAKAYRQRLALVNKGARHIVYAARFAPDGSQFSFTDGGEPKNTAGRPCFDALRSSGAVDIGVCVVRFFGGVLLGTGGLSRAYKDSVMEALKAAEFEER